jgi:hypothetical protein
MSMPFSRGRQHPIRACPIGIYKKDMSRRE